MGDVVIFSPGGDWKPAQKLVDVRSVDIEELAARQSFTFLRESFQAGLAYVRHPHAPRFLIPYNEFNEYVLLDKYNEVLRVMTTLGASSVKCTSYRARTRMRSVRGFVAGKGGSQGRVARSESRFDYESEGAGSPPRDPRPLRWPGEPGIEAAINAVLLTQATKVRVTINRENQLSTTSDVVVTLTKLGVDLGIHSSSSEVDTLEFEASFPVSGSGARRPR